MYTTDNWKTSDPLGGALKFDRSNEMKGKTQGMIVITTFLTCHLFFPAKNASFAKNFVPEFTKIETEIKT